MYVHFKTFQVYSSYIPSSFNPAGIPISKLFKFIVHIISSSCDNMLDSISKLFKFIVHGIRHSWRNRRL